MVHGVVVVLHLVFQRHWFALDGPVTMPSSSSLSALLLSDIRVALCMCVVVLCTIPVKGAAGSWAAWYVAGNIPKLQFIHICT